MARGTSGKRVRWISKPCQIEAFGILRHSEPIRQKVGAVMSLMLLQEVKPQGHHMSPPYLPGEEW